MPENSAQRKPSPTVSLGGSIFVLLLTATGHPAHGNPGVAAGVSAGATAPDPPTFYADVLPILQQNCQACHQPAGLNLGGMVAPMSFMTFEETRPWARVMALAVEQRKMPPWHASRAFEGKFQDERYLDESEIETIVAWAAAGAPEGTPPAGWTPPERPEVEDGGWALGEPDLVLQLDEAFRLEDDVEDLYVTLTATLTEDMLPEDRWIKSVEYRPGPHVHHILRGMGGLAPGNQPQIYEDGYGRLMQKGTRKIEFDMHYHKDAGPGTAAYDQTQVGIRFMEPGEVVRYRTSSEMLGIMDFVIPPGESSYSASREYRFDRDVYIAGFTPHMHLRGKAALYELVYPDGRHEQLLHVPKYDFSWQHSYNFKEPVLAPAGSTLRFTLWWDNSENNPSNPDPTAEVRYGEPTTAEMGFGFMQLREVEEDEIVVGQPISAELRAIYGGTLPMSNDAERRR
jgi:mono/diheme cytochrome c family protein